MSESVEPALKGTSIALISVKAAQTPAALPPPPAVPAKVANTFKPLLEISIPNDNQASELDSAGAACAVQDAVLNAILRDPAAVEAIRGAPAEVRSVADAIVIWNEGWNLDAVDPATALYRVRAIVEQGLKETSPVCLDEAVTGPRLLPIPDADGMRTTIIVVGSGTWTWRMLLAPPIDASPILVQPVSDPLDKPRNAPDGQQEIGNKAN